MLAQLRRTVQPAPARFERSRGSSRALSNVALRSALLVLPLLLVACESEATATPTASPGLTGTPAATPEGIEGRVASTVDVPTEDLPRVRFSDPGGAEAELAVEAPTPSEYSVGLSGRGSLEAERGMLFYYPGGDYTGNFWMRNTHIDLDIAFVDADFVVIDVLQMEALTEETHHASAPYLAAIEANAGWFEENGVGEGATVEFLFDVEAHYAD